MVRYYDIILTIFFLFSSSGIWAPRGRHIYRICRLFIILFLYPETGITKDNPAFSMINDSDEEVIYGSDEESRRPLTARHVANEDI